MAIVYTETENGGFVVTTYDPNPAFEGALIPDDMGNRHRARMQAEIDALEATLIPYTGSPQELIDAINVKIVELQNEFQTRTGFSFNQAAALSAVFELNASQEATDFTTNLNAYAVASIFIAALLDVATVNAYNVQTDPAWA